MAIGNAKNIVVGAGALYIGATENVEKTELNLAKTGSTFANSGTFQDPDNVNTTHWESVGYTSEGAQISFEPDYGEVQVDQLLDVAKIFKQGQRVMLGTTLTEATLENLLVVVGGKDSDLVASGASTGAKEFNINGGSLGYTPLERSICLVGPAPTEGLSGSNKSERVYVAYRALSMDTVTVGVRRNEATVFPASFRLLASSTNEAPDGNGSYGKIIDRVYT